MKESYGEGLAIYTEVTATITCCPNACAEQASSFSAGPTSARRRPELLDINALRPISRERVHVVPRGR